MEKSFVKYIIFKLTPHLFFDKLNYMQASVNDALLQQIKGHNNVYIFLGCDYPNLGDYAITIAQKEILMKIYPNHQVHVIPIDQTYSGLKTVLTYDNPNDVITSIGGGNMGELYYGYERKREFIIRMTKDYSVISFPQTISYSDSLLGRLGLNRSRAIYNSHPNLILLAREEKSYEQMKRLYPRCKVLLTPDVVMTLNRYRPSKRKGCVMSIRNDKESILSKNDKQQVFRFATKHFTSVEEIDTCPDRYTNLSGAFTSLLSHYANAELLITDRLHGMIFAYITGTPAIVLPNSNGKIVNSYRWIKDCGYIQMVSKEELYHLSDFLKQIPNTEVIAKGLNTTQPALIKTIKECWKLY